MTYNVCGGMLNPTLLYLETAQHSDPYRIHWQDMCYAALALLWLTAVASRSVFAHFQSQH